MSANQGTAAINQRRHNGWIGSSTISAIHGPIEIGNCPGLGRWIVKVAGNEMQMEMLGTLAKGDGIDAIAPGDLLHEITGITDRTPPT